VICDTQDDALPQIPGLPRVIVPRLAPVETEPGLLLTPGDLGPGSPRTPRANSFPTSGTPAELGQGQEARRAACSRLVDRLHAVARTAY
jgi:hypothetical protein